MGCALILGAGHFKIYFKPHGSGYNGGWATGGTSLLDTQKGHPNRNATLLKQWPVACEMAIKWLSLLEIAG